jgi:hypothetical protein
MRPLSVSQIKNENYHYVQNVPASGSVTRAVYDKIVAGEVVSSSNYKNLSSVLNQLQLFYGLDINRIGKGLYTGY